MKTISDYQQWRQFREGLVLGTSVGLVPTMGYLHEGHAALLRQARRENDIVVLNIFVNPTQFDQRMDLSTYPDDTARDDAVARACGVDLVLRLPQSTWYADDYAFQVNETHLSHRLEGAHRPGHYSGVLTIVSKIFNVVQAQRAYFGEKDFQQLCLVRQLVEAMLIPTTIISVPTQRDEHGLALSSRHARMTPTELDQARLFSACFQRHTNIDALISELTIMNIDVDYCESLADRWVIAVRIGKTRLVDEKIAPGAGKA